jgi:glyoxylase-like metal-dependent hydrolase (beta-lactamase superfamily II)
MAHQVFRVSENIWCVRRPSYLTCSYLVRTPAGVVLVDAGMDSSGDDVRAGLRAMGLSAAAIRAVLLTHWHNDHAAGASAMHDESGAPVYYHASDAPFLTRETAHPGLRGWLSDRIPEWGILVLAKGLLGEASPVAVAASGYVSDGDEPVEGFEVIGTPGHTPGHVCYYYRPERALFAGDALAVIGDKIRFMSRPVTPDLSAARKSMRRCLDREIDILCPGHRTFLTDDVPAQCRAMRTHLDQGGAWPLFG